LAIVRQFSGKKIGGETLKAMTKENFEAMLGYPPHSMVFIKH
jgi:hypothetical protein